MVILIIGLQHLYSGFSSIMATERWLAIISVALFAMFAGEMISVLL